MPDAVDFKEVWASLLDRWINADEDSAEFPRLSSRSRSLLRQLTPVIAVDNIAVLKAPSKWARTETENNLSGLICDLLGEELGSPVNSLSISVDETAPEVEAQAPPVAEPVAEGTPERQRQHWEDLTGASYQHRASTTTRAEPPRIDQTRIDQPRSDSVAEQPRKVTAEDTENRLNPQYTFDTFVTGSSNQFANAACRAVAEKPAYAYNPLFIWGESGLGKTHLLHAIGHYARELRQGMKVRYISSEEMTNEFVNALRDGRGEQFKRHYRNLDMLIVDDIQFLQGKESTQEEFFHTFNALQQNHRQIVLSSDRPPKQLTTLEDRLRTRFEGGLITDVQTPDLETRMAILSKKAQMEGTYLPDDVLELIASRYETSIRELEGAMIRVTAYCSLSKEPVTRQAAEIALRDIMPDPKDVEITPQIIIEVITGYFDVTVEEMVGKGKVRRLVTARQFAMYLCRELTELSLPQIGKVFGGRDHTTAMYAERKIRKSIQEDRKTFQQIQELTQRIKSRARQ
ncbi:chromosomal replication initiator protein DnaA [Corynebacterium sp. USCH3]|uniref:chromosomal replication initiator protein DnaA n=1 Tax=Corynebacterium sp. USCH3 TaxID=3024840 RepID=UPI0030951507